MGEGGIYPRLAFASPATAVPSLPNVRHKVHHSVRRPALFKRHVTPAVTNFRVDKSRWPHSAVTASASSFNPSSCRVAIVGGGVSGLSTALALVRTAKFSPSNIHIFESRPEFSTTQSSPSSPRLGAGGAALNLSGGAAVLISEYNLPITERSVLVDSVVARTTAGRRLFSIDVKNALRKLGRPSATPFQMHTIMRTDLLSVLTDAVRALGVNIHRGTTFRVTGITDLAERHPRLYFQDGALSEAYDLVIGADGVRSAVRQALVGEEASASYTGFRCTWALCPRGMASGHLADGQFAQWFGDGGYLLHYQAGPPKERCEILVLSSRQPERAAENPAFDPTTEIRQSLENRLVSSRMPQTVLDVFDNAVDFIDTGVYAHKPTSRWFSKDSCVLVGDSGEYLPSLYMLSYTYIYFENFEKQDNHSANQFSYHNTTICSPRNGTISRTGSKPGHSRRPRACISPFSSRA